MKHILYLLFSITSFVIAGNSGIGLSWGATNDCWFEFTCPRSNPSEIAYCQDGTCTVQGGSNAASASVGALLSKKPIHVFVSDAVRYFLSFVSLIAVIYFLYAGAQLMTSEGDEEKAKKTRKIMIYVIVGMIIIWMAYWLVLILINSLN